MTDVRGLESDYDIRGELRGTDAARFYIGRRKQDGGEEVAITVFQGPKDGGNNALSHFASDAQLLSRNEHPNVPRVIEGRWVGNDQFALVTERVVGVTLDEMLERGEKFTNPRAAMLLQEIAGALDWARDQGVVHRLVVPETLVFARDTNRPFVTFTPAPVPMTGVPGPCGDARTIGRLAWAIITGHPHAAGETRSIGEVCPNLAKRVVDATDEMIRCKDTGDAPDIGTYLGILAAGDALKQAEVELAAMKEEYDEEHRSEIQKCELQRQETEQHAAEQAAMLAGEREEFKRQMEADRAAFAADRAEFERIMNERKDRFAAVRAELDQQRAELERRLGELEAYRAEVERVRDEALAARDVAKTELAKVQAARADAEKAAKAQMARVESEKEKVVALPVIAEMPENISNEPIAVPVLREPKPEPVKLAKPPKPPKWKQMEPVDLEHTDEENIPEPGRPRWMIPSFAAAALLIIVALFIGVSHRSNDASNAIRLGNSTVVPTAPTTTQGYVPRGGFFTQSAGGAVTPGFTGSPAAPVAAAPDTATSRALTQHEVDSIAAIQKKTGKQIEDTRPRRRPTQAEIDSVNTPSEFWNRAPAKPKANANPSADSVATAAPQVTTPPVPPISTVKRDSAPAARKDTVVKRDTIKPDTAKTSRR